MLVTDGSIRTAAEAGLRLAESMRFTGADPYDGLSAPIARALRSKLARQLWVQLMKRSGHTARSIFAVTPVRMAKSLSLFSMAATELGELELANTLVDDLLGDEGGPWGYEFDVQTRWAFYGKGTPNVVATTFALRAIDRLGRIDEVPDRVGDWLTSLFDNRGYFSYVSTSNTLIHNGSLLAAESLARLGRSSDLVQRAVDTTVGKQRPEGGWPYGEDPSLEWEDSFHTIYVIDSLTELAIRGFETGDSTSRALTYWKNSFFTQAGEPLYFASDTRPSDDIHNNATVLGAVADYGDRKDIRALATTVAARLLRSQNSDGSFRSSLKAPLYLRWNQGHAVLALSKLTKRDFLGHRS